MLKGNYLSVEDFYNMLKNWGERISLFIIYRILKLMVRMGILWELELVEGYKYYEIN